eukprot:CAMPEP_0172610276 /NCGR_PEP_ID=MMETSP1068-20121228/30102_1 /TAXON_ID=35684 /ORGANISM="Pseudopedinella elastica, Strain CCMP716" /LENGTH=445 /DNA_ID=CAMNT_0013413949 /DNA_START=68 /DNA_END=1405 /DNA_ORIENTATION=-
MDLDHGAVGTYEPETPPDWALEGTNLANERLGTTVLFATDEWFARAESLLNPLPATFDPDAYSPQGKTLDGWESRRRRLPGHDWCIIKLGIPGRIRGLEVDTAFFTGNQVPRLSVEAAALPPDQADGEAWGLPGAKERNAQGGGVQGTAAAPEEIEQAAKACAQWDWKPLLEEAPLRPGYKDRCVHFFPPAGGAPERVTHLRVSYFPDGGVARLRVWGDVARDFATDLAPKGSIDLASVSNGGRGLGCSNKHYGVPRNLLQSGRGVNMGDGWETGRHPDRPRVIELDPATGLTKSNASDWALIQLGAVCGGVEELVVDTNHFKGNFPESCKVDGCLAPALSTSALLAWAAADQQGPPGPRPEGREQVEWFPVLARTRLKPNSEHVFKLGSGGGAGGFLSEASSGRPLTHARLTIFPDGGVMRLRVIGKAIAPLGADAAVLPPARM